MNHEDYLFKRVKHDVYLKMSAKSKIDVKSYFIDSGDESDEINQI
jgi:hypothetical protein